MKYSFVYFLFVTIGSGNGLVTSGIKSFTWTDVDPNIWCHSELTDNIALTTYQLLTPNREFFPQMSVMREVWMRVLPSRFLLYVASFYKLMFQCFCTHQIIVKLLIEICCILHCLYITMIRRGTEAQSIKTWTEVKRNRYRCAIILVLW